MGDPMDIDKNLEEIQEGGNNNAEVIENQTSDTSLNKAASEPSSQLPDKSVSSIGAEVEANVVETNNSLPVDSTNAVEQTVSTDKAPVEPQCGGQVRSEADLPADSSEQRDSTDIKTDKKETSETPLRTGNSLSATNVRHPHPEDNNSDTPLKQERELVECSPMTEEKATIECSTPTEVPNSSFTFDHFLDGDDSGTEEEQCAFMKELENFHRERSLDFKPPKFYGEGLNCLKLWREVTKLGGHEQVTTCKLWRQVGESFKPPKTCTTVSWTFRIFYEKALLEYEKHKIQTGELQIPPPSLSEPIDSQVGGNQTAGSGRARRDAAARAMQGWHSQRLLGNGEVGDPIIKDKNSSSLLKKEKNLKSISSLKKRKSLSSERVAKVARTNVVKSQVYMIHDSFFIPKIENQSDAYQTAPKDQLIIEYLTDVFLVLISDDTKGYRFTTEKPFSAYLMYDRVVIFQGDIMVTDVGDPADWVKINVRRTKDCFEVYALVPGLLREEVQVQSDPAGRLIISGEPEQPDNPWGVTPFKKVITLPSRIDPHQTSAVVTLHGQLFVRAPFDLSDL